MSKSDVLAMLQRPLVKPAQVLPADNLGASIIAKMVADAERDAKERAQPLIDAAESSVRAAEAEREKYKAQSETLQKQIADMHAMHEQMQAKMTMEADAKDRANAAYEAECDKTAQLSIEVAELNGRLAEMTRHNASLQTGLHNVTNEIGKRKPEKPEQKIPDFNLEVVSRDLNGAIKTVSIKPK